MSTAQVRKEFNYIIGRRDQLSGNIGASDEHLSSHYQTPPNGAASAPRILTRGLAERRTPTQQANYLNVRALLITSRLRLQKHLRFVRSSEFMLSVDPR